MFQQQIIGSINLSLPILLFFYMFPGLSGYWWVSLGLSLIMGIYIWYLNYLQHTASQKNLLYIPSDKYRSIIENHIKVCNIDASKVTIKYAYTAQQIMMTIGNTVVIDPTTCTLWQNDINAVPVINVFHQLYEPYLNNLGKERQLWQSKNLTAEVQSFIFKHELGHVIDFYAYKKLWIIFLIGTLSVFMGINTAILLIPLIGRLSAIIIGITLGLFIDIFLTLFSNVFFKAVAEKKADLFAAKHSTNEEIIQAANFFDQEQDLIETYKDPNNLLSQLPLIITSGHPNGKNRKAYLLKLIENK